MSLYLAYEMLTVAIVSREVEQNNLLHIGKVVFADNSLASVKLHVRVRQSLNLAFECITLINSLKQIKRGIVALNKQVVELWKYLQAIAAIGQE